MYVFLDLPRGASEWMVRGALWTPSLRIQKKHPLEDVGQSFRVSSSVRVTKSLAISMDPKKSIQKNKKPTKSP